MTIKTLQDALPQQDESPSMSVEETQAFFRKHGPYWDISCNCGQVLYGTPSRSETELWSQVIECHECGREHFIQQCAVSLPSLSWGNHRSTDVSRTSDTHKPLSVFLCLRVETREPLESGSQSNSEVA